MKIKSLSLSILTSLALVTACQPVSQLSPKSSLLQREGTSSEPSLSAHSSLLTAHSFATVISGKVEFPTNPPLLLPSLTKRGDGGEFSLKATQTDISKQATVSLIYPSDHPTLPNVTIATGLSDALGNFTVKPGTSFSPAVNSLYVLEATRRIGSSGNDNMALRTYLKWNGAGWESMTTPGIYINATTTALAIIQDNLKYKLSSLQTIGEINISGNSSVPQNIGNFDKIVFQSGRNTGSEIYTMNSDGSSQTRMTTTLNNYNPSFSPDGSKIVFSSNRDTNSEIYIMSTDGTGLQTRLTNNTGDDSNPSFSPDGSKIIFHSNRTGNYEIYKMDVTDINTDGNGDNLVNLTIDGSDDKSPVFSPDGSKIAFVSNRDGNNEIYIMNSNGSGTPIRLTNISSDDLSPSFSADTSKVIFTSNRDGNNEIYKMDVTDNNSDGNGDNLTNLTINTFNDDLASFSPEGLKIYFTSNRSGNNEIYTMNLDGSMPNNLSNNSSDDKTPNASLFIKSQTISDVATMVNTVLSYDHDPMEYIKLVNGKYQIEHSTTVTSIAINIPTTTTPALGSVLQLSTTVNAFDNTHPDITWTSSEPTIATVDNTGKVITIKAGNATITATSVGKSDSLNLIVVSSNMVFVQGGTYQMGFVGIAEPLHSVTLSSFYIGKYEVTQGEYQTLKGSNPSNFSGTNKPVEYVSWWDALSYCNAKSISDGLPVAYKITGNYPSVCNTPPGTNCSVELLDTLGNLTTDITKVKGYRLPTEAEWQYAARGGNKSMGYLYSGSNTLDHVAWHYNNSLNTTHEVGTKVPNELGIYDMSGNVWEWQQDMGAAYSSVPVTNPYNLLGAYPYVMGGPWTPAANDNSYYYPSKRFSNFRQDDKSYDIGFRIVRAAN